MSPRWGLTWIYHDGRPTCHSANCSEHNAREFFDAWPPGRISLVLWRREKGKRATVDVKNSRNNMLRIAE